MIKYKNHKIKENEEGNYYYIDQEGVKQNFFNKETLKEGWESIQKVKQEINKRIEGKEEAKEALKENNGSIMGALADLTF